MRTLRSVTLLSTILFLLLPALGGAESDSPSIRFFSPLDGDTVLDRTRVVVELESFDPACNPYGTPNQEGEIHWHLDVDCEEDSSSCSPHGGVFKKSSPGHRVLRAYLVENDGTELDPPVEATVNVDLRDVTLDPVFLLPAVAHAPGAEGAFFRTELWLTNPTESPMILRLRFDEALWQHGFGPGSPSPSWTIPARRTIHLPDLFEDGIGSALETFGILLVEASGEAKPVVRARTFDGNRRVGQELPVHAVGELAARTASGHRLHGLGGPTPSRTNLGLVNLAETAARIEVEAVDPLGLPIGDPIEIEIPRRAFVQLNRIDERTGVPDGAWFDLVVDADQPLDLYASRIDVATGDPLLVTEAPARSTHFLSGLSGKPGGQADRWASRLSLSNPAPSRATVKLELLPASNASGNGLPRETEIFLEAGETRNWEDLLPELLGMDASVCSLRITTSEATPISAWATTELVGEGGSRRGQLVPAGGTDDLVGAAGALLPGLTESGARRTNVGFFNTARGPVDVTATLVSASGDKPGHRTWTLAAGETLFVRRSLAEIGPSGGLSDALLHVSASVPGAILAWGSVVENDSGDARFVTASSAPAE